MSFSLIQNLSKVRLSRFPSRLRRVAQNFVTKKFKYFRFLVGSSHDPEIPWSPEIAIWAINGFQIPSPPQVKRAVLERHGEKNATWIETGTYLAETSVFLSRISDSVFSIEPSEFLYQNARKKFGGINNIQFIHGTSEQVFESTLLKCTGNLNIFLDGHYSEGETFQGDVDTPLHLELDSIIRNRSRFGNITLFVDDVRCMNPNTPEFSDYPSILEMVSKLDPFVERYLIEHDILIAFFKKNFVN